MSRPTALACAVLLAAAQARADPASSGDVERPAEVHGEGPAEGAGSASAHPPADGAPREGSSARSLGSAPARPPPETPPPSSPAPGGPPESAPARGFTLAFDLGGGADVLGGWAYPKIALRGSPDNDFHAPGLGPAFQLLVDFSALDLDWRLAARGTMPGYLGLRATVGVDKDVGPWTSPRLVARVAGGLEFMMASAAGATFLVPVFLAEGEVALEISLVPDAFDLGVALDLDARYGLPLGAGFNLGGFLRANFRF